MIKNKDEVLKLISKGKYPSDVYADISDELRADKDLALKVFEFNDSIEIFKYLSDELRGDEDVVIKATKSFESNCILDFVSDKMRNSKKIIDTVLDNESFIIDSMRYIPQNFKKDKNMALKAVSKNGYAISFFSDRIRNDKDIIKACHYPKFKDDDFTEYILKSLPDEVREDKEIVMKIVSDAGWYLAYASDGLRDDKDVVLKAVENSPFSICIASERLRKDKDLFMKAVEERPNVISYAFEKIRDDEDVIKLAFEQMDYEDVKDGTLKYFLSFASERLRVKYQNKAQN